MLYHIPNSSSVLILLYKYRLWIVLSHNRPNVRLKTQLIASPLQSTLPGPKMDSLKATNLYSVEGMVAVITGGATGQ